MRLLVDALPGGQFEVGWESMWLDARRRGALFGCPLHRFSRDATVSEHVDMTYKLKLVGYGYAG